MRTHNISPCKEKQRDPYYASWPGAIINPQWLELPLSRTNFMVPNVFEPLKFDCTCMCIKGSHYNRIDKAIKIRKSIIPGIQ